MKKKLNLGCGQQYAPECVNWDISKAVKADAYLDVRKDVFPADDETFDLVYCGSILEQILENEQLVHCLNECHRVLKPGGKIVIIVPDSRYSISFLDPFDCRHFMPGTFDYFDHRRIQYERYGKTYGFKPWEVESVQTTAAHILNVMMRKI